MKNNFLKYSIRKFSKSVSIPPKLRNAGLESKKNQSLYKYESLIENPRDNNLEKEKSHYNNLIENSSKNMIYNHFKLNDSDNNSNFNEFYTYTSQKLDTNQINKLIHIIDEIKIKLDSDNIEKTEDLFRFLISKLYYITEDKGKKMIKKNINEYLFSKYIQSLPTKNSIKFNLILIKILETNENIINMISKIPLKQISTIEIFKSKNDFDLIQDGISQSSREKNKNESAVALSMIINNYEQNLHLKNPEISDMGNPEIDFKDAMSSRLQSYDKSVYLFQKKSELTQFEKSNYIFFNNLPVFFPVKSKSTNKIMIKQLTNNILIQNVLQMNKNQYYLNFNKAILEKTLSDFSEIKVNIKNIFFKKDEDGKTTIDHIQLDENEIESIDFILASTEFQELQLKNIKTKKNINSKKDSKNDNKTKKQSSISMDDLIENTKFMDFKKIESDEVLKKYANSFIYSNGFIVTKDYKTKSDILKSSAGVFGFHILGRKNINLIDADFMHFINIRNNSDEEIKYKDLVKKLNNELKLNNFSGPLLELPENKAKIDLANELFMPNSKINIRFNSFKFFYEALQIFETKLSQLKLKCRMLPTKNIYYDDSFVCSVDFVLKNNYPTLKRPLMIECDYLDNYEIKI